MASIGEAILKALGGITVTELAAERARAYEAGFYDGGDDEPPVGDVRKFGYRKLATMLRDFDSVPADRRIDVAWKLWLSSPMAKRILVIKRDHIIERGTKPTTEDETLLEVLLDFWKVNKLGARASEFALQLFLFGEQCYPVFVRESDGRVMLGYIDPAQILEVVHHPDNALEPWAVVLKETYSSINRTGITNKRVFRIIREAEPIVVQAGDMERVQEGTHDGLLVTAEQAQLEQWEEKFLKDHGGRYDGTCFFTKVNAVSNQPRGVSDLIQLADWIDQADATLFAMGDREQMSDFFSWDVTVGLAGDTAIKERANEIRKNPPSKGSVNVHNETEVWDLKVPDLKQYGSVAAFRAFLGFILGGAGFPVHWYGFGDDANRATATAQGDPTEKSLEHDQGLFKDMMLLILRFVRDQAVIAGSLDKDNDEEFELPLPEIGARDAASTVQMLGPLAMGLIAAKDAGWVTQETAAAVWARVLSEFGIEVNATTELEKVAKEDKKAEEMAAQVTNNALAQRLGQNGNTQTEIQPEVR